MVSEEMVNKLNEQMRDEMYSSHLYLAMAADFCNAGYKGFENWMFKQACEEREHAHKFYRFINDIGAKVEVHGIQKPPTSWKSPMSAIEDTINHEQKITASIHRMKSMAEDDGDHETAEFLLWFVKEQVEEKKNVRGIHKALSLTGKTQNGIMFVDKELANR
jgi:ferritin